MLFDKNSGLLSIGIGKILRRIASIIREDIILVVGLLQVCAGQEMHEINEDQLSETVLLVYASNTFNMINRNAFLHNINHMSSSNKVCSKLFL